MCTLCSSRCCFEPKQVDGREGVSTSENSENLTHWPPEACGQAFAASLQGQTTSMFTSNDSAQSVLKGQFLQHIKTLQNIGFRSALEGLNTHTPYF